MGALIETETELQTLKAVVGSKPSLSASTPPAKRNNQQTTVSYFSTRLLSSTSKSLAPQLVDHDVPQIVDSDTKTDDELAAEVDAE